MSAYYEDQRAERRRRWDSIPPQASSEDPAAAEPEPVPADEPPVADEWTYYQASIGIIPLPVTHLAPDDKPRCDDCGYRIGSQGHERECGTP